MTITPGYWDFTGDNSLKIGGTFQWPITWKAGGCTPVDLTNMTAILEARAPLAAASPFMTLTTENGGIIIETPTSGRMVLYMSAQDTAELTAVRGVYDLRVNFNNGQDVGYLLQGKMTVQEMVVRP